MNACIGIISYFPDSKYRTVRAARCETLITRCREVFGLPMVIIAQNWNNEIAITEDMIVESYNSPLTILGARQALRTHFLASNYDYLIMFDDDCVLEGTSEDGQRFLTALTKNPDKYLKKDNQFKLFAVSKDTYNRFPLPPLGVENGTGIEDMAFFAVLKHSAPEDEITGFEWGGLKDASVWRDDQATTWHRQNIPQLIQNTKRYIYGQTGTEGKR